MNKDLNLAMTMSLKDKLVVPLQRAVAQVERNFRDVSTHAQSAARNAAELATNLARVGREASNTRQAATDVRRLADETARARVEARALDGTYRDLNGRLRNANGRFVGGAGSAGGAGFGGGLLADIKGAYAGSLAFSHVVATPLRQAADYDTSLRQLANTAYGGKSLADRRAGMRSIDSSITGAVRFGGGTREDALSALNEMVASGVFGEDPSAAMAALPVLMKGATASGARATDLATIAIRAKQSMGINDAGGLAELLDRSMAAGQAGGFELRDMAKWLPQQMASARSLGLSGMSGMTTLLAANQAAVITAGTRDEAGNNLVNLLGKINSQDTASDFRKIGIDLPGSLAKASGQGMNALDAFVALVDKVVGSDPKFKAAQHAARSAQGPERAAAYESVTSLLQGSAIGKVVQDRQALMALSALMNNRSYLTDVKGKINGSKGAIDDAAALLTEGAGYKYDQLAFDEQEAQTRAMNDANSAVSKLAQAQSDLYRRYPDFAKAVEGAKVAIEGLGAAAAGSALIKLLTSTGGGAATGATVGAAAATSLFWPGVSLAAGGVGATLAAFNTVQNNSDVWEGVADNGMESAMSGDMGIAAAIMAVAKRPVEVNVHLDGRQIESSVTTRQTTEGRRQ